MVLVPTILSPHSYGLGSFCLHFLGIAVLFFFFFNFVLFHNVKYLQLQSELCRRSLYSEKSSLHFYLFTLGSPCPLLGFFVCFLIPYPQLISLPPLKNMIMYMCSSLSLTPHRKHYTPSEMLHILLHLDFSN